MFSGDFSREFTLLESVLDCYLGLTVLNQNNGGNVDFSSDSFLPK
jgi:hypothetical protein